MKKFEYMHCDEQAEVLSKLSGERISILSNNLKELKEKFAPRWDDVAIGLKQVYKQQYQSYLRSPEWQIKRDSVLSRDDHKCRICGSTKDLHVHHLTYDRVYDESLYDLVTVCKECHKLIHILD